MSAKTYKFLAASVLYCIFAGYICGISAQDFSAKICWYVSCFTIASLGTHCLAARWISAYPGRIFAGLVYGFNPYCLSFAAYHPTATAICAVLPWLFIPTVYLGRKSTSRVSDHIKTYSSAIIPFAVIAGIFLLLEYLPKGAFFPLPIQKTLQLNSFFGLIEPTAIKANGFALSFFHVGFAWLVMGTFLLLRCGKAGVIIFISIGLVLATYKPLGPVPPMVWGLFPVLTFSIVTACGMQCFALATEKDCKWLTLCATAAGAIVIADYLLFTAGAITARVFITSIQLHGLGAVTAWTIFFIARSKNRWHPLRWILLISSAVIDIAITSTIIINKIL